MDELGIEVTKWLYQLEAGDTFKVGSRDIKVVTKNKRHDLTLEINGKKKRALFRFGAYYGTMGKSVDWMPQYYRDIEGYMIVDLLNVTNPFHTHSVFSKLLNLTK